MNNLLSNCIEWDLEKPYLPPRSRLYSLTPMGIGTMYVESLTSYIARLAAAHRISVGVLVDREIGLLIKQDTDNQPFVRTGLFSLTGAAINSTGVMAENCVRALEILTGSSALRFLTMLTWAAVLPPRELIRRFRAWCPACYQHWYDAGQVIYDPLLWSIEVVTVCPLHQQLLQFHCPHCHASLTALSYHSRPGYCSKCRQWLGSSASSTSSTSDLTIQANTNEVITREGDFQRQENDDQQLNKWIAKMVGELLASAPNLLALPVRKKVADALSTCINQITDGNVFAFSRVLQVSGSLVWQWRAGEKIPLLGMSLHICDTVGISLLDFFTQEIVVSKPVEAVVQSTKLRQHASGYRRRKLDCQCAHQILEAALNDEIPPPTLKEVAKRIPTSSITLRNHFPHLCFALTAKHSDYQRSCHLQKMKQAILNVLETNNYPPPSLNDIVEQLDYTKSALRKQFPELCIAISARYINYRKAKKAESIAQTCNEIRQIMYDLHAEGIYPSSSKVSTIIGNPHTMRIKEFWKTWNDTLRELGLQL